MLRRWSRLSTSLGRQEMLRIAREINKGKKDWAKFTNDKTDKIKEEEVKARLG